MTRHELSWMDDRVHPNTIQALRDAWRGIHPDWNDEIPAWVGLSKEDANQGHALQARLSSLLDGIEGDDVGILTGRLAERHALNQINVDALDLALARRTGTDMLAALCLTSEINRMVPGTAFIQVVRGPAKRVNLTLSVDGGQIRMAVPLSTEASWNDGSLTIQRVLPNTFQIAVMDKPLSQVVSHPLLDPLELTITDIEIRNGRETRIRTDYQREMVAAPDLGHADLASDESALDTPPPSRRVAKSHLASPF